MVNMINGGIDPLLQVLFRADDFKDGINRGKIEAPESRGQNSANNGEDGAITIRPCKTHGPQEILHDAVFPIRSTTRSAGRQPVCSRSEKMRQVGTFLCI